MESGFRRFWCGPLCSVVFSGLFLTQEAVAARIHGRTPAISSVLGQGVRPYQVGQLAMARVQFASVVCGLCRFGYFAAGHHTPQQTNKNVLRALVRLQGLYYSFLPTGLY